MNVWSKHEEDGAVDVAVRVGVLGFVSGFTLVGFLSGPMVAILTGASSMSRGRGPMGGKLINGAGPYPRKFQVTQVSGRDLHQAESKIFNHVLGSAFLKVSSWFNASFGFHSRFGIAQTVPFESVLVDVAMAAGYPISVQDLPSSAGIQVTMLSQAGLAHQGRSEWDVLENFHCAIVAPGAEVISQSQPAGQLPSAGKSWSQHSF